MPRATGVGTTISRYEDAWEAINRVLRRGESWSGYERNCFFVQTSQGEFANISGASGLDAIEDGRGLAVWDFDRDGDPDLLVKNRNAPQIRILRNDHDGGGARLTVRLAGTVSGRQAIGARVTLEGEGLRRVKEVTAGSGFLSQSSRTLFFGLGERERVETLRVRWPTGRSQSFRDVPARGIVTVIEGEDDLRFEQASAPSSLTAAPQEAIEPPAARAVWLLDPVPLPPLSPRQLPGAATAGRDAESGVARPELVAIWSPDCPQCLEELGGWQETLSRGASSSGVDVSVALRSFTAAPAAGSDEVAQLARIARTSERFDLPVELLEPGDLLALGVFLEELVRWPREVPLPASILLDRDGLAVRVYRGPVSWETVTADARAIPATPEERLRRALPFPGKYHSTDIRRNEFQLGVSYQEVGLLDHALAAFERSLAQHPGEGDTLYNLGVLHQRRGEPRKAEARYREALRGNPEFVDARANLGVLLAEAGRLAESEEAFRAALAVRPDHLEAVLNLGNVLLESERADEALATFRRAAQLDPRSALVEERIGAAYRHMGDGPRALAAYRRAVELAPADGEVRSNLGVLQAESGDLSGALASFEKAIELSPDHASAYSNAGLILERQGDERNARTYYERAIELAPDLDAAYFNLVRVQLRAGRFDDAIATLDRLLARKPGHDGAARLREDLRRERSARGR